MTSSNSSVDKLSKKVDLLPFDEDAAVLFLSQEIFLSYRDSKAFA
jgi:hypothetical protein